MIIYCCIIFELIFFIKINIAVFSVFHSTFCFYFPNSKKIIIYETQNYVFNNNNIKKKINKESTHLFTVFPSKKKKKNGII